MQLNADFSRRVVVHSASLPWKTSPMAGVDRRMLDRIGGEVARATSIVRYAADSHFSAHTHGGGEEFLVLDGTFEDEHGAYPRGSYVRNPPGSSHTPGSSGGCTIFVKLWQFDPADRNQFSIDTSQMTYQPAAGEPGIEVLPLHSDDREDVALERWSPGTGTERALPGGLELLVLEGSLEESGEQLEEGSWLRLPAGSSLRARSGREGCRFWIKTGHLATPPRAPDQP